MENNKKSGKYSNEDVLKVVSKLPEVERDNLLETLTVADISKLMNDKTECDNFCDYIEKIVVKYSLLADAVRMLNENMDAMLLDDASDFSVDYDKLNDSEKEHATVALLNNDEFKKNCFNILERNFKNLIDSDEVMVALDKTFGLSKIYKKCLDMGRKSDYIYEV